MAVVGYKGMYVLKQQSKLNTMISINAKQAHFSFATICCPVEDRERWQLRTSEGTIARDKETSLSSICG